MIWLPNTQPIPPILEGGSKSPLTWPVVRPAAPNGSGSGFVGGHDSVLWPAPTKPREKSGPKNTFFVGRIEAATGSGLERDMFFWKMISDLMNWWFDRLMICEGWGGGDGWWWGGDCPYVWFKKFAFKLVLKYGSNQIQLCQTAMMNWSLSKLKCKLEKNPTSSCRRLIPTTLGISQAPNFFGLSGAV